MLMTTTFLILISQLPYIIDTSSVCVPNSQILLNGIICNCNKDGEWIDANCYGIGRRQVCRPGQVIFQGCSRCICQETGQLSCSEEHCSDTPAQHTVHESLDYVLPWCKPYRIYYISCNICVCPASGRSVEAHCAVDTSCSLHKEPTTSDLTNKKNTCIAKVMYLFPCLHCLCSDDGYFLLDKCVETCVKTQVAELARRCIPNTLYRNGCNVCICPETSFPDDKVCTHSPCTQPATSLRVLKSKSFICDPYHFTQPRCFYCHCDADGVVDEKSCIESECLKSSSVKFDIARETCSPGEIVPICTQCLCPRNGMSSEDYCSKACSYHNKISVLEKVANTPNSEYIMVTDLLKRSDKDETCEPNSVYIKPGRYCLCPDNGNTNFDLCTTMDKSLIKVNKTEAKLQIDFNATCEPNTFVEFDCNTCLCSKKGKLDPKWCTYDDCDAKRKIQELHSNHPDIPSNTVLDTCTPGTISRVECNFCICTDSGYTDDRVCTKNDCSTIPIKQLPTDQFTCEPLAYYEVDCNICFCPRDGMKNLAKCTKNHCEKGFLRSDVCLAGQLYSDDCNVCVCPLNGNKLKSACTNKTCTDTVPWKKIFQLSDTLLGNQIAEDATRTLDLCFLGEEFIVGCKLCVCPDMGLRMYASCTPMLCDEDRNADKNDLNGSNREVAWHRKLNTRRENCITINVTAAEKAKHDCTPGSMYIMRCKECICPYMGAIEQFCRPLPIEFYCEQAFPNFNYMPVTSNRRMEDGEEVHIGKTSGNLTTLSIGNTTITFPEVILHEHTRYECSEKEHVVDNCFVCACNENELIVEHCYKSNARNCENAMPSFLLDKP